MHLSKSCIAESLATSTNTMLDKCIADRTVWWYRQIAGGLVRGETVDPRPQPIINTSRRARQLWSVLHVKIMALVRLQHALQDLDWQQYWEVFCHHYASAMKRPHFQFWFCHLTDIEAINDHQELIAIRFIDVLSVAKFMASNNGSAVWQSAQTALQVFIIRRQTDLESLTSEETNAALCWFGTCVHPRLELRLRIAEFDPRADLWVSYVLFATCRHAYILGDMTGATRFD